MHMIGTPIDDNTEKLFDYLAVQRRQSLDIVIILLLKCTIDSEQ